ncbi:hypothetical protein UFOVP247_59 [uncultured Caudovirales phage]|uniref:Uncharacterized protein n=1 Tax=uncultured Caudovirales phage TaxID=2100421 RepID=A0A6J7WSL1_9CAUD|nr:hypothetical protein UFOVP247_59 [uncultured Caudovirales phage]
MAKKAKRAKYTSKGERHSVSRDLVKAVRREKPEVVKIMDQLKMWAKGKRTMVTIANPNPNETNKRFIRVEGNHPAAFGPWKRDEKKLNRDRSAVND